MKYLLIALYLSLGILSAQDEADIVYDDGRGADPLLVDETLEAPKDLGSDLMFRYTQTYTNSMLSSFPKEDYHYIFLGRTTRLASELASDIVGDNGQTYIPVKSLKELADKDKFKPEDVDSFWKEVLPSKEKIAGKKLIIYRSLWTGWTMREISHGLIDYLKKNNYSLPLETFFLVSGDDISKTLDATIPKEFKVRVIQAKDYAARLKRETDELNHINNTVNAYDEELKTPTEIISNISCFKEAFQKSKSTDKL